MSGTVVNNSDQVAVFKRVKVLEDIESSNITSLLQAVQNLDTQVKTVRGSVTDYWTEMASDNYISPAEKQSLNREWASIQATYAVMIPRAETAGITSTASERTAYVAAYTALDTYLNSSLVLFGNLESSTYVSSPAIFDKKFTDYYTALDALQDAIENGRDATVEETSKTYTDSSVAALKNTLTSTAWITSDLLSSGIMDELDGIVTTAATGFINGSVASLIDAAVKSATEDVVSGVANMEDAVLEYMIDTRRSVNSILSRQSTEIDMQVQNLENETWAELAVKEDEITAAVGRSTKIASLLAVQADRIQALVEGFGAEAYMTSAIGLVWLVTAETYASYINGLSSSELAEFTTDFTAVYGSVSSSAAANVTGADEWQMLAGATATQKATLRNFLEAAGKVSSYITLKGNQIVIDGDTLFTNASGSNVAFMSNGKLSLSAIDVNSIFTQDISVGKCIYGNGSAGKFFLNSDGSFSCINGSFSGAIDSGCLHLSSECPESLSLNYEAGAYLYVVGDYLVQNGIKNGLFTGAGTYAGNAITSIDFEYNKSVSTSNYDYITSYIEMLHTKYTTHRYLKTVTTCTYTFIISGTTLSGNKIITDYTLQSEFSGGSSVTSAPTNGTYYSGTLPGSLAFNVSSSSQTFRLLNLPTQAISSLADGVVYVENGFLKIKGY